MTDPLKSESEMLKSKNKGLQLELEFSEAMRDIAEAISGLSDYNRKGDENGKITQN